MQTITITEYSVKRRFVSDLRRLSYIDANNISALKSQCVDFCSVDAQNLVLFDTFDRTAHIRNLTGISEHEDDMLNNSASIFRNNNTMECMVDFRERVIASGFRQVTSENLDYLDTPDLIWSDCYKEAVDKLSTH